MTTAHSEKSRHKVLWMKQQVSGKTSEEDLSNLESLLNIVSSEGFLAHGSDMFDKASIVRTKIRPKQEDYSDNEQHGAVGTAKTSEQGNGVVAAQDAMEEDVEDQIEVMIDAKDLVAEVYHNVKRVVGEAGPSRLSVEKDQYGALLSSTIKRLKTISTATKKYIEDLRGLNRNQLYSESLLDIWESFKNSIDVDLAKTAFG